MKLFKIILFTSIILYCFLCIPASLAVSFIACMGVHGPIDLLLVLFFIGPMYALFGLLPIFLKILFFISCSVLSIDIIWQFIKLKRGLIKKGQAKFINKIIILIFIIFIAFCVKKVGKYDFGEGNFVEISKMLTPRSDYSTVLLNNGNVLITGGNTKKEITNKTEIFNPKTSVFYPAANMNFPKKSHSSLLLKNGNVLVLGGMNYYDKKNQVQNIEIYDVKTGKFFVKGSMKYKNADYKAILLEDGKVFILYKLENLKRPRNTINVAEIYNPEDGKSKALGKTIILHRNPSLSLLPNKKILICGGYGEQNAEIYDYGKNKFELIGKTDFIKEGYFSNTILIPLNDNKILLIRARKLYIYNIATGELKPVKAKLKGSYSGEYAILLKNGKILLLPVHKENTKLNNLMFLSDDRKYRQAIYDTQKDKFSYTKKIKLNSVVPTLLKNGDILITPDSIQGYPSIIYKP